MEGAAWVSGSRLNEIPHNKLCVCEYSKQQLHQANATKDAAIQAEGARRAGQQTLMLDNFIETMKLDDITGARCH